METVMTAISSLSTKELIILGIGLVVIILVILSTVKSMIQKYIMYLIVAIGYPTIVPLAMEWINK
jgi:hypothetical protein